MRKVLLSGGLNPCKGQNLFFKHDKDGKFIRATLLFVDDLCWLGENDSNDEIESLLTKSLDVGTCNEPSSDFTGVSIQEIEDATPINLSTCLERYNVKLTRKKSDHCQYYSTPIASTHSVYIKREHININIYIRLRKQRIRDTTFYGEGEIFFTMKTETI